MEKFVPVPRRSDEGQVSGTEGARARHMRWGGPNGVRADAQRPPVDLQPVTLLLDHLGRDVLGRATDRVRALARAPHAFREPKIDELPRG